MTKICIKPLSVNEAWQGRRFKTDKYKAYEKELLLRLKPMQIPDGDLWLNLTFGFLTRGSDWDNGIKNFQDILSKRYKFNDNRIFGATVKKVITNEPFIEFAIEQYKY